MFVFIYGIVSLTYSCVSAESRTNFWIKSLDVCESNGPVKFYATITTDNKKQFIDANLTSPIPLDNNIGVMANIETLLLDKTYVQLFTIREKSFCQACNKYLGEFWYDIERAAQITPKTCPIHAGRYYVHHMPLDFHKMTLQTFPFGTLKVTVKAIDNKNNQVTFCMVLVVENNP